MKNNNQKIEKLLIKANDPTLSKEESNLFRQKAYELINKESESEALEISSKKLISKYKKKTSNLEYVKFKFILRGFEDDYRVLVGESDSGHRFETPLGPILFNKRLKLEREKLNILNLLKRDHPDKCFAEDPYNVLTVQDMINFGVGDAGFFK